MGWVLRVARRSARFVARFLHARNANVAIIYGLSLIPLLAAAGSAVDLSRALVVRARLAQALDAAGLAVGATLNLTQPQMQDLAQKYFDANYPASELGVPSTVQVSVNDQVITLSATAQIDTALMYLVGINQLNVGVSNEIVRDARGLELAMVLDTTGSMSSSGKIQALRDAATEMVNSLSNNQASPQHLKIGLVPFAMAVRLDTTQAVNGGWIDTNGTNANAQLNFTGGKYAYWLYTNAGGLSNTPWLGCVEARPDRLDETDTAPSGGSPDTRWVPHFSPDAPDIRESEMPRATDTVNVNQSGISSNFTTQYIVLPNESVYGPVTVTQNSTNISTGGDRITISNHGFSTGQGPIMLSSSGTMPGGISSSTAYWVIRNDSNTIKLATSQANAGNGTAINITSVGTNNATLRLTGVSYTTDTLFVMSYNSVSSSDATPYPGKDVAQGVGYTRSGHGMNTGDGPINVYRSSSSGTMPAGLSATTDYWAIRIDANAIKLATSRANALAGTAVNFTSNGSGTFSISEAPAGTDLAKQAGRQENWQKYVGRSFPDTTGTAPGPNKSCVMQPITPITNDMNAIKTKILQLNASGSTNIPNGLGWGWRLISPAEPYSEGVAYSDDTIKAIVLMTDGTNDPPNETSTLNNSGYATNGFAAQALMGTLNNGSTIDTESEMKTGLDEALTRLCNNIKAVKDAAGQDRIRIYTIALMVTDVPTINLLQSCATTPAMFFNTPTAALLQQTFQAIAQDLSNLRLSK